MPKVGNEHFPYTKSGYKAAAKARALKRRAGKAVRESKRTQPGAEPLYAPAGARASRAY